MADQVTGRIMDYGTEIWAVAADELSKLAHDPTELATRAIQPVLWLVLFGELMAQVRFTRPHAERRHEQ